MFQSFYFQEIRTLFGIDLPINLKIKTNELLLELFEPGEYAFEFRYQLPQDPKHCPFSIQDKDNCGVFYHVVGLVVTRNSTLKTETSFLVEPSEYFALYGIPSATESKRKRSGLNLIATAESLYCVGDTILVNVSIQKSDRKESNLRKVKVCLFRFFLSVLLGVISPFNLEWLLFLLYLWRLVNIIVYIRF